MGHAFASHTITPHRPQGNCKDWVSLFTPKFSVVDPLGSDAVTRADDLLQGCLQTPTAFRVVNITITSAYTPLPSATAVQWRCTSIATNGCQLDFAGVDVFNLQVTPPAASLIQSLTGYFDPSIPGAQMNCSHAAAVPLSLPYAYSRFAPHWV